MHEFHFSYSHTECMFFLRNEIVLAEVKDSPIKTKYDNITAEEP